MKILFPSTLSLCKERTDYEINEIMKLLNSKFSTILLSVSISLSHPLAPIPLFKLTN